MNVSNLSLYPRVMGIVNVTPDSFYAESRMQEESALRQRVRQILDEGGTMIDVGACSTRPGAQETSADDEISRLSWALPIIHDELSALGITSAEVPLSIDTFRAQVAEICVTRLGADIINDISGGTLDNRMFSIVAQTRVPYILTCMDSNPLTFFSERLALLRAAYRQVYGAEAVPQVILDPGFGFGKTLEQNYQLMSGLQTLIQANPACPMLVGISRKSMIYRLLDTDAEHALNGTTVLNTFALMQGAHILRVHDVREAVEAIKIITKIKQS